MSWDDETGAWGLQRVPGVSALGPAGLLLAGYAGTATKDARREVGFCSPAIDPNLAYEVTWNGTRDRFVQELQQLDGEFRYALRCKETLFYLDAEFQRAMGQKSRRLARIASVETLPTLERVEDPIASTIWIRGYDQPMAEPTPASPVIARERSKPNRNRCWCSLCGTDCATVGELLAHECDG